MRSPSLASQLRFCLLSLATIWFGPLAEADRLQGHSRLAEGEGFGVPMEGGADLSIIKAASPDPAFAGMGLTYTLTISNPGPASAPDSVVVDSFPLPFTGVTWTCTATPGSTCAAAGSGDLFETVDVAPGGTVTFIAAGTIDASFSGPLANSASVSPAVGVTDPNPANNVDVITTPVLFPTIVEGTMEVAAMRTSQASGMSVFFPGDLVTYHVTLFNLGPSPQLDNPDPELVNELPPELQILSATADSGIADVDTATNTVSWNGAIPAGGQVFLSIDAQINQGTDGLTVYNQGAIHYDADGDGINESTVLTDDPKAAGVSNPTRIRIRGPYEIPTLSHLGLFALALVLGAAALRRLRRAGA